MLTAVVVDSHVALYHLIQFCSPPCVQPVGVGGTNGKLSEQHKRRMINRRLQEMRVPIRNGTIHFREASLHVARCEHLIICAITVSIDGPVEPAERLIRVRYVLTFAGFSSDCRKKIGSWTRWGSGW
eukprot:SAG25_NODE_318_length_9953_cov_9.168561_8_plen_127_part_00